MSTATPRMRMFAGPNGSGKSTIKARVEERIGSDLFGVYINADDIERQTGQVGYLDISAFGIATTAEEVLPFFVRHPLLVSKGRAADAGKLTFSDGTLFFNSVRFDSYFAAAAADFLRQKLLEAGTTFTFETVMSHHSKVELLKQAQEAGFRTYLYFVATEDPEINVNRVKNRVAEGGHDVEREQILDRYRRSLGFLAEALKYTNRSYIFDNSSDERVWVAEVTDGDILELKTDMMPVWFKEALWDTFASDDDSLIELP